MRRGADRRPRPSSTCRVPSTLTRAMSASSGDRVDDAGEVHDHVDALEQRLQLGAGDVDAVEFERAAVAARARARRGRARGRRRDARRARGADGCPTRPAAPVTAIGRHLHTLTAWPTVLNLRDPDEPDEPAPTPPTFRRFLFGGPGGPGRAGQFDPVDVRLLADRPQPGDADAAVDRPGQLGGGAPDRRVGRARGPARAAGRRRPTASSSRSSRTPRRPSWSARPGSPPRSPPRLATVGPKGWVDLHLVALRPVLEALATTLGEAMQHGDDDDPDGRAEELVDCPGFAGTPFAAHGRDGRHGQHDAMLAPALLGVQAGSMIGYLAQHALGRYDLPPAHRRDRPMATSRASASWSRTSTRSRRSGRSRATTSASTSRCTSRCTRRRARCRGCASGWCASRSSTCRATRSTRRRSKPSSGRSTRRTRSRCSA